jgi:hypothetical protein
MPPLVFGDPASIDFARDPRNKIDNIVAYLIEEFGGREVDEYGNPIEKFKRKVRTRRI